MLYPLLSVPVGIARARDPVEAHGRPLPTSLPRAYNTASTSWRQQCAHTEAGMLRAPGFAGCRHAQPEQCMHMRGPACGPVRVPSVKRSTRRRNRRALRVEQRSLRRWVRKARVRPFRRAINHAGAWTGWRSRRREACGHTCAECAQGRRSWVQVRQTHPHPVALTPVGSVIAVESVVDDLEPAAQSGSRRAMMPYDCPPSHLPTRPCRTPRQRFSASAKTMRERRHLRHEATVYLKGLNALSP